MPNEYESPLMGLVLQGNVAVLRREVGVLRRLNATLQAENTRLRLALANARLPHAVGCLTVTNAAYPCSCGAGSHNARIDAALNESPDNASAATESPGTEPGH